MATTGSRRNRQETRSVHAILFQGEPYRVSGQVLGLIAALATGGCDTSDTAASSQSGPSASASDPTVPGPELVDTAAFNEAFEVIQTLELEETDEAMTVQPMVRLGGDGTFLLAEPLEGQVNLYGTDGRLRRVVGGRGEGPGEFRFPFSAHPTLDGDIVVADLMLARLTFFPGSGGDPEVAPSPIMTVQGAQDLGDERYLLTGTHAPEGRPRLLHIWNRGTGEIERSILPMGVPEESLGYAMSFQGASATLEADTIWAVWALSDTLYKFNRRGDLLSRIPLPMLRPMGSPSRAGEGGTAPGADAGGINELTQLYGVYVLEDGNLLIQSMQTRNTDAVWDILILDRESQLLLSAGNMPQLLAVERDLLYFDDPASVLPSRWLVARWRGRAQP